MAVKKVDIFLVEDGGPLEGCGWQEQALSAGSLLLWLTTTACRTELTVLGLASRAMAQLAVQRLLPAQLVLHLAAVAARLVQGFEVLVRLVHAVWRAELPLSGGWSLLLHLVQLRLIHLEN